MAESSTTKPETRVQHHYLLTFQYMKDDKSPEKYLSTLREKGVSFKKTEIKQTKENYPFKELISVFEIDVIDECGSSGEIEKTILRSWCSWAKENEPFGWVSIKPRRLPYLISKTKRVTEIKDAKFCVGGFKSPTEFCQHFPELPCSIIFEYDTDILTILFSCDSKNSIRFELSTKTIINSVVIKAQDQELFFCIETSERFKLTILTGGNKVARTNLGSNLSKHFGLSSVIQISFPDETLDVALEIIAYLKRKGITVVYADIQLTKSCNSLDELNRTVQFIDFETEYAWQSLLHRGYKVIDAIEKDIIEIFKENKNSNFADRFFEMESLVDNNIFFCFEHNWKDASKTKEVEYDGHENLESNTLYVRRIVVTPASEIYFKKEPTKQNRVLLQYKADFFLRVVFRDEDFKKMQLLSKEPEKGSLVERIKQFLIDGIRIGDRHFEFLGNSNSQLREHGAWLVAEHDGFTAESIRKSLGDFTKERCIASYVSRLGLCFSSSMKTVDVDKCELISDIENNDYCFTDGIGKMSKSLAKKISTALQVSQPSALQIRYAGCKGVIAFDPELGEEEQLVVRDSMVKFQSPSKTLEILQWTRPGQLFLNRQVITLMSGLGVPDRAFLILQQNVLMDLANMLIDEERAFDELTSVLKNIQYEKARKNGLLLTKEPFFRSILITIYKYRVDGILKKSRIPIHWSKGRIMMGTVDETRTLNYGEVFISYSNKCEASKCKVIVYTGSVVVAKNPCFHPGDLRKFKAVDIPKLHHMVDCIVFPQKGHRPHPDEMSGSDLDGDMYFVCWDQSFIPPNKNETPMDFPKAAKKKLQREIRVGDVVDFFGDYIKNDRLGVIANAHVVHADMESIFSEACLELAKMHSYAVDFPKTGHIPEISKDLTVEKYPDFMMKKDKPVYTSEKILGKLFRQCEFISKIINRSSHIDLIIENAIAKPEFLRHGYKIFSKDAQMVLNVYTKKISNLMNQYGIKTEAELFTGMLMSMKTQRGCLENETFEITEMIQTKLSKICRDTRNEFFKEFGGEQNAKRNLESVHAKASAWYMASYGAHNLSLRCLSFPWLVAEFVVSNTGQQDIIGFEQSGYTEIGSTVEKHVLERLSKRRDLFDDIKHYIKNICEMNPNILNLPLVGVVPLCLLSDELKLISFYLGDSQTVDISTYQQNRFTISSVSDPDILSKTNFVKCLLEQDSKTFYLLSYILDWFRDSKVKKAPEKDELDFAYTSAHALNSDIQFPMHTPDLFALNLKWKKIVRLSKHDQYSLGRETVRFFKEYLNHITTQEEGKKLSIITEEVFGAFLDLSLSSLLDSIDYENDEEFFISLPFGIWNHLLTAKEYVEQKMHEEMGLSYVNIGMLKDGCPVLHAYGPYDKLKDMQWLLDSTAQFDSLLINTPARDMIVIRNSVIFTFEGCSGKDDLLEYNLYKGDCNEHHKTLPLAIPSLQRIKTNKKIIDCQVFMQTCMKQIETTSKVYNQLFHGDMLISIVFGRLYLVNAPDEKTSILIFEKKISELTDENEKLMKSGKVLKYKGRKIQQNQKHFMKKSFIPINYDVTKILQVLRDLGFELQRLETSYKLDLYLEKTVFGKDRKCIVSLDEALKFKHVTFGGLTWVVADVIREKYKSQTLADFRFKLNSRRKLSKESARKIDFLREVSEGRNNMLRKIEAAAVTITKDFAGRINYVKKKTEYIFHMPGEKYKNFDIRIASSVEYSKVDRNNSERIFRSEGKRNEISIIPMLPDLSCRHDWNSLLRQIWEFSVYLSDVFDTI